MIPSPGRSYQERSAGAYKHWRDAMTTLNRELESLELLLAIANERRIPDQAKVLADAWCAVAAARKHLLRAPKPPGVDGSKTP